MSSDNSCGYRLHSDRNTLTESNRDEPSSINKKLRDPDTILDEINMECEGSDDALILSLMKEYKCIIGYYPYFPMIQMFPESFLTHEGTIELHPDCKNYIYTLMKDPVYERHWDIYKKILPRQQLSLYYTTIGFPRC